MGLIRELNCKFRNFIFRKRLGRSKWSARLIFFVMSALDSFEVYMNTEEVDRFDHYVPQLLLRRWRISETGVNKGQIFSWDKNTNLIEQVGIASSAGKLDWDLSKSQGKPSDYIRKKIFAELLEDKASRVIKLINDTDNLDLTFLEESTLAVFIGHQITRVPSFRNSLTRFFELGSSKGLIEHADFGNKETLTNKVAKNSIGMTYEEFLYGPTSVEIKGGKPQLLLLSLVIGSDIGEKIYMGNLHILEIPTSSTDEFVISDNPVVLLDLDRQKVLHFVPWWEVGKKDFWIFIPISPKKALFYCKDRRKNGPIEKDNESLVQLLNFGQYLCSSNKVFSRDETIIKRHLKMYAAELYRN